MSIYDLHTHSVLSDGSMTAKDIIHHAASKGIQGVSITDHDTIGDFVQLYHIAQKSNITCIPGVELSTDFQGESVHILGYAYNPSSSSLYESCLLHGKRREERNIAICNKLVAHGMQITYDEVQLLSPDATTYGRPHIAKVLMQKGYIQTIQEGFKRFLGSKKSCYVAGKKWPTEEAIEVIHASQGYAVLAHPHLITRYQKVQELIALPFDGIEAIYSRFSPQDNNRYIQLANSKNLLITGGSDFHGSIKPHIQLGIASTPLQTIEIFKKRLQEHFSKEVRKI